MTLDKMITKAKAMGNIELLNEYGRMERFCTSENSDFCSPAYKYLDFLYSELKSRIA